MSEREECPRLIEVQRLWEGELDGTPAGEVRRHLTRCSGCRAEYESWEPLSRLLASGDPASPLGPERRQRLKEQLLARVPAQRVDAASLEAASNPERRDAPRFGAWHGRRPVRMILALAPLAAALLLLLVFGRHVPPGALRSAGEQSRIGTASPLPRRETQPGPPRKAVASDQWLVASRDKGKNQGLSVPLRATRHPPPVTSQAVRSRHRVRRARSMAALPERPRGRSFRQRIAARPSEERRAVVPGSRLAAPKPIERVVIQVDAPPPVEAGTLTHVSISAVGDPRAPGAQLAVVRSRKEEVIP